MTTKEMTPTEALNELRYMRASRNAHRDMSRLADAVDAVISLWDTTEAAIKVCPPLMEWPKKPEAAQRFKELNDLLVQALELCDENMATIVSLCANAEVLVQ